MADNLRCETCSHWRTSVDVDRRICPMWHWWTYADDWCVAFYERTPFADDVARGDAPSLQRDNRVV